MPIYPPHSLRNRTSLWSWKPSEYLFLTPSTLYLEVATTQNVSFFLHLFSLTTMAVSVAVPPQNALEHMHHTLLELICCIGAVQDWLSFDTQPSK